MSDAADRLQLYLQAEKDILGGQEVRMDGRYLRMPDLIEIRKAISELKAQVAAEGNAAGGSFGPPVILASFNERLGPIEGGELGGGFRRW